MIQILLFKTHKGDPLCGAISALTRGQYTHAAVRLHERTIIEAFWPKVRMRDLADDELAGIDAFDIANLTADQSAAIDAFLRSHIGDPYSVEDLFRFVACFRAIWGDDNEKAAANHHFCSMLAFQAAEAAGVHLLSRIQPWEVSPNCLSYSPLLVPAPALN